MKEEYQETFIAGADSPVDWLPGPYLLLDIDRRDCADYERSFDYDMSLAAALEADKLVLSDSDIQGLWQFVRHLQSITVAVFCHGSGDESILDKYMDTLDCMDEIVGRKTQDYINLYSYLVGMVEEVFVDELVEHWLEEESEES